MADFVTGVSAGVNDVGLETAATDPDPSGVNRWVCAIASASAVTATDILFNGPSGTSMNTLGTGSFTFFFDTITAILRQYAPGPNADTTVAGNFSDDPNHKALSAAFYREVNQTTPVGTVVTAGANHFDVAGAESSLVFTGLTPGTRVVGLFAVCTLTSGNITLTAAAGTLRTHAVCPLGGGGTDSFGTAIIDGVADGSGNVTLTLTITSTTTTENILSHGARGYPMAHDSGSAATILRSPPSLSGGFNNLSGGMQ